MLVILASIVVLFVNKNHVFLLTECFSVGKYDKMSAVLCVKTKQTRKMRYWRMSPLKWIRIEYGNTIKALFVCK